MNLREKILIILGVAFICAIVIIAAFSQIFYLGNASDVERLQAERDVQRTLHTLDYELTGLDSTLADWAWWDETYRFSSDLNDEYITKNLGDATLQNLQLNYFIILSQNGTVLYAKGHDLRSGSEAPVPERLLAGISKPPSPFSSIRGEEKITGIMTGPDRPVFIGAAAVLTSTSENPGRGFLVLAREVDDEELARLSKIIGYPLSYQIPSPGTGTGDTTFIPRPFQPTAITIDQNDPDLVKGTATLSDSNNIPSLYISIQYPRDSYKAALVLIRNYLVIITVLMAFFAGFVILLVDQMVLARLSALIHRVRLRETPDGGKDLARLPGSDEFVHLDGVIAESQQKIRDSEAQYRRIIETSREGICILDAEQKITFANERMTEMLGLPAAEVLGRPLREFIVAEEIADHMRLMAEQKAGASQQYERRFIGKDGHVIWTLVSSTPILAGPELQGSFAMITDITDRKQAEIALSLATKKLSTLNVLTFNDIQNQLFTLQGYLDLSYSSAPDGKLKEYISRQKDVANRIRQQIGLAQNIQIMGTRPPAWQSVGRVFLFAISHIDLSNISRKMETENIEIFADPLLENVLFSLADNSRKHGKNVTEIRLSCTTDSEGLVITYEDNGQGIPSDKKEAIFLQQSGTGAGVSLFLAREILSITGITIRETGTPGMGARFEIRVPRGAYRFSGEKNPGSI